jgi:nucleoside-diphosphate-sugar epimerase
VHGIGPAARIPQQMRRHAAQRAAREPRVVEQAPFTSKRPQPLHSPGFVVPPFEASRRPLVRGGRGGTGRGPHRRRRDSIQTGAERLRIALTGASGYTGGHLLRTLVDRGDEVAVLVRSRSAAVDKAARIVEGDLRDPNAVRRFVEGADAVLHVAAVYRTAGHPDAYYRDVNVRGSLHLLEAAAAQGVARFVHTSTVGVHGHVADPPADETAPYHPGDIYQETKVEAELLALRFHRERGLPVAVVRPGAIYGPAETRLLKLFRSIARGRYAVVGTGRTFYHPVYIDDLVQGFLLALDRPEAVGQPFLVCGPEYVSQDELAARIARATGGRVLPFHVPAWPLQRMGDLVEAACVPLGIDPPLHRRRVDFWTKSRAFSIAKARKLLGYAPQVSLDEGLARTVASYRELGWL